MLFLLPENEPDRLRALIDLGILDTPPDEGLEMLTAFVKKQFDVPIALISLVDEKRQWFKAKVGLDICETQRQHAFCAYSIMSDEVMVVTDATKDPRFSQNPYVIGDPWIKAYAGAPIIISSGIRVGTLCVIDTKTRNFTRDQLETLAQLAALVSSRAKLLALGAQAQERAQLLVEANKQASRAQVILAVMSDGVVVQDKSGAIISTNQSACTVLGLTHDQLMGRTSIDSRWRAVDEDGSDLPGDMHPAMVSLLTGKPVNNQILGIEQPDGVRRWLRVSSRPLFEDGPASPSHAVATFSDITEIVEKGQALQKAQVIADDANSAKGAFLANMSHEIRTPLNGVIGLTSVLCQTELSGAQREMVDLIKTSGETLERLLSDILDVSKMEAGKLEIVNAPMNLQDAVNGAALLIGLRADEKGISFNVHFGPGTDEAFIGDCVRIRQIISNLTSNALKFTSAGEINTKVEIEERPDEVVKTWLKLTVSDTGMGFDDESAQRLFSRFEQADSSITRAYGGTGLGLAICRSLTHMMGGSICVSSTQGVGSIFTVSIPLARAYGRPQNVTPIVETMDGSVERLEDFSDGPLRVLMAEDHPVNQRVTSLCLAPWGADITIAANGVDAVEAFKLARFDIVLMDMQMPEMDGLEATRQIRLLEAASGAPRTPIAMLSANAMAEHVSAALAAGCDNHIAKPIKPESLARGMEEAMYLAAIAKPQVAQPSA
jgi:two-component system, sensor histidine kinase